MSPFFGTDLAEIARYLGLTPTVDPDAIQVIILETAVTLLGCVFLFCNGICLLFRGH